MSNRFEKGHPEFAIRVVDLFRLRVATGQEGLIQRDGPRGFQGHQFRNLVSRPPEIAYEGIAGVIGG